MSVLIRSAIVIVCSLVCVLLPLRLSADNGSVFSEAAFTKLAKDAEALANQDNLEGAAQLLESAIALSDDKDRRNHPRIRIVLTWLAKVREEQGRATEALRLHQRALEVLEQNPPLDRKAYVQGLFNVALVFRAQQKMDAAEAAYRRAREVAKGLPGSEEEAQVETRLCKQLLGQRRDQDAELPCRAAVAKWEQREGQGRTSARILDNSTNLATLFRHQGKFDAAEELFQRIISDAVRVKGYSIANVMNNLASMYEERGRYQDAEKVYQSAIAAAEKEHDTDTLAILCHNLAGFKLKQGVYPEATRYANRALTATQSARSVNELRIADELAMLGAIALRRADYSEAEKLQQQALNIRERRLASAHPQIAENKNNLAILHNTLGEYRKAEDEYRQAIAIYEKLNGQESADAARSRSNLAVLLSTIGQHAQAEQLALQALNQRKKVLGENHPDVADSLNSMASIYQTQGDYEQALSFQMQAMKVAERAVGRDHIDVANYLNNLGDIQEQLGQYSQAAASYGRAIEIRKKRLSELHPDILHSYSSVAGLAFRQGDLHKAEELFQQMVTGYEKAYGPNHMLVAVNLNNLGAVVSRQGDYRRAESLFLRAMSIIKTSLGSRNPHLSSILSNLANLHLALGELKPALAALHQAVVLQEDNLQSVVSEPRVTALLALNRGTEDAVYGLLLGYPDNPEVARLAMALALLRKGRALEIGRWASQSIQRSLSSPEQQRLFAEWQELCEKRERMLFLGPAGVELAEHEKQLDELRLRSDRLAHELARTSMQAASPRRPQFDQVVAAVAARLPPGGALVEIVRGKEFHAAATGHTPQWGAAQYVELLLRPNGQLSITRLGAQTEVDAEVAQALSVLSNPASAPQEALTRLFRRLHTKMEPVLHGVRRLYLSTDGSLNLLPWAALYDGKRYLVERYEIHYLSSGRDLLDPPRAPSQKPPLIVANPDFLSPSATPAAEPKVGGLYALLQNLPPLRWAASEATEIAGWLRVEPLLGKMATEAALRAAASPSILHVATHGVFLVDFDGPPSVASMSTSHRMLVPLDAQQIDSAITSIISGKIRDPLDRSALALAGATQAAQSSDARNDGILTADEVRALDLAGTELVTLSGCETARGITAIGQGVYGLRRAFLLAGAQTLVSSLWQVSDEETNQLMRSYYRRLLSGQPRVRALHEAMLDFKRCQPHPYFWAPFIAIGHDAPLNRVKNHPKTELRSMCER